MKDAQRRQLIAARKAEIRLLEESLPEDSEVRREGVGKRGAAIARLQGYGAAQVRYLPDPWMMGGK